MRWHHSDGASHHTCGLHSTEKKKPPALIDPKRHFIHSDAGSRHYSRKNRLCHFSILQERLPRPDELCRLYLPKQDSFLTGTQHFTRWFWLPADLSGDRRVNKRSDWTLCPWRHVSGDFKPSASLQKILHWGLMFFFLSFFQKKTFKVVYCFAVRAAAAERNECATSGLRYIYLLCAEQVPLRDWCVPTSDAIIVWDGVINYCMQIIKSRNTQRRLNAP